MSEAKIDISLNAGNAPQTLGQLEQQIERVTEELKNTKIGSQEYKNLQQELVQTTKQVKNLELGFEALDREQVAGELGSVAGAVGDITGAVVLLGGENENLEAMVANIEKGIGISMAFKGAIEGASSAWKLLNNVMRANPIGLIITAIAALIAGIVLLVMNWGKLNEIFDDSGKKLKNLTDRLGKHKEAILIGVLGPIGLAIVAYEKLHDLQESMMTDAEKNQARQERLAKAQSKAALKRHQQRVSQIEEEQELRKKAFNEQNEIFDLEIDRMEAEGKNANELKKAKIEANLEEKKAELETINELLNSWTQYYEDLFRISGKSREDFLAMMKGQGIDLMALQEEANDRIVKAEQEIFAAETELIKFNRELREQSIEEEVEDEEEKAEKVLNIKKRFQEEQRKLEERRIKAANETRKIEIGLIEDEFEQKRELLLMQHEIAIEDLDSRITEENELIIAKELELNEALKAIDEEEQKRKDEQRQANIDLAKQGAQDLFDSANSLQQLLFDKEMKRAQEKTARGEKLTAAEVKRLKRQDKIQKAFALAQIAADTARGVSGAIAAGAGVPFPFNLAAIASGIAAVISGSVQAAQVLGESVDIPEPQIDTSGGEAGATDSAVPDVEAAQFGSTLLNQQKVFVVESDITNTQNSVAVIEAQASFN